ncbi:hypothetical protein V1525DRAFT_394501, partial [Lipomyces kononenkoae]
MAAGSPSPAAGQNGTGKLSSPVTSDIIDTPASSSSKKLTRSSNKQETDSKVSTSFSPNGPPAKRKAESTSINNDPQSDEDRRNGDNSNADEEEEEEVENGSYGNDQASEQSLPNTDVPFTIVRKAGSKSLAKKSKTRKHGQEDRDKSPIYAYPEDSPDYVVQPKAEWEQLSKYSNFVVGDERFTVGDYIFVNHNRNMRDITLSDPSQFWIGRVLEIRASDPSHVYIRLFWMYWPNELPGGRRYYHGNKELVASNHMDVIDAMTVAAKATVSHWLELDDDDKLADLFWRQRYDSYNNELMPIRKHCKCKRYYNPDTTMIWCSSCNSWLHEECVINDIKKRYKDDMQILGDDGKKTRKKQTSSSASKRAKTSKDEASDKASDSSVRISIDEQGLSVKAVYTSKSGDEKTVSITCLICGSDI